MVVKKNYLKTVWREIRGSLPRFLAIFCITALGVGFLAGLLSTTPDMRASADAYYDEKRLMDIRLLSSMGFCAEDVTAVEQTGGVQAAEGGKSADLLVQLEDGDTVVARVHGVDMQAQRRESCLNQIEVLEGRFPEKAGECLILLEKVPLEGTEIGKKLVFAPDNADLDDKVCETEMTVTGVAVCPYYMSLEREQADIGNGRLGMILFVPMEQMAFDYYTEIYASVEDAAGQQAFTDAYQGMVDDAASQLKVLAKTQVSVRRGQIIEQAQADLQKARDEYESKKAETEQKLEDAWQEILDGRAEIAVGDRDLRRAERQLREGRVQLEQQKTDGQAQLDASAAQLEEGEKQYADGLAQYNEGKAQLEEARARLDEAEPQIQQVRLLIAAGMPVSEEMQAALDQYEEGLAQYEAGYAESEAARVQLEQARADLDEGKRQLDEGRAAYEQGIADGQAKLEKAARDIESGRKKLEKARAALSEGEQEYEEGKAEAEEKLLDAEYQIRDAEAEISKIETPKWYVLTRKENVAYASFESNAEKVAAIAKVFPFFFFLVALLVTLTTMTRMVEEERTQIGTLKALGYSSGVIAFKYVLYAGLAGVLGSAFGLAIGLRLFPAVIWNAYGILYTLPPMTYHFNPRYALLSSLSLNYNSLTDISILGGCLQLKELSFTNNQIADISALASLNNLEIIDFSYNNVYALPEWNQTSALRVVQGSHNSVSSIYMLGGMSNLTYVSMDYNKLTDISALANCQNLVQVNVYGNTIGDVSTLTSHSIIVNYDPTLQQ